MEGKEKSTTMFRLILAVTTVSLALSAVPPRMLSPDKLAFILGEEEFEDYLDKWLAIEERNWFNATTASRSGNAINHNKQTSMIQLCYIYLKEK